MAWTDIARREHNRDSSRYPSDLMDREWALIAPLLPLAKRGGRPRTTCLRAVFDAILYISRLNEERCIVLYDRALPKLEAIGAPRLRDCAAELAAFLDDLEIALR